jgi:pimeloyl-ACP methyl ester carboxylesterase
MAMVTKDSFIVGGTQALQDAVVGISLVVEGMHKAMLNTVSSFAPVPTPVPVIIDFIYQAIRGVAASVGAGSEHLYRLIQDVAPAAVDTDTPLAPWQLHCISACSAAFGDFYADEQRAWSLPMSFCRDGAPLALSPEVLSRRIVNPSPRVVIFLHGLGMNDLLWQDKEDRSFGRRLEDDEHCTCVWLRYNTGKHIHQNGEELTRQLEEFVTVYPVAIESLTLVGHSMGGLLARSACHYGKVNQHAWLGVLRGVACLGSPHQGALLENLGNWVSYLLTLSAHSAPLALISKRRSAGIKDLRHGSLRHEDWETRDPDGVERFSPHPVEWVAGVKYLLLASRLQDQNVGAVLDKLGLDHLGDGLVSVRSALYSRADEAFAANGEACPRQNNISQVTRVVVDGCGHVKLPTAPEVYQNLLAWYRQV